MYTSVSKNIKEKSIRNRYMRSKTIKGKYIKRGLIYLFISMFCALFGGIYEIFSHGVYSNYMIYAFLFPLIGGSLINLFLYCLPMQKLQSGNSLTFYNAGIATLTTGSIVKGILDIYGTENVLVNVYWYAGIALVCIGIICYVFAKEG